MIAKLVTALVCAAALVAPVMAEARNRVNEEQRRSTFGNYSDSELRRFVSWYDSEDVELVSGVFVSTGGYAIRADGRAQTFFAAEVHNTTSHGFCLQLRQTMASGPLAGYLQLDNSGFNTFVEPGGRTTIAAYVAPKIISGDVDFHADGLAWLQVSGGPRDPVCGKPPELERLKATPIGTHGIVFLPDLLAKLEGLPPPPPYQPGNNRAAVALTAELRREGVTIDPSGRSLAVLDEVDGAWGPLEVALASSARSNDFRFLTQLHNGSSIDLCVVAAVALNPRLKGNVRQSFAPSGGFFLGAGTGRTLVSVRGDEPVVAELNSFDPNNLFEFNPAISVWDAPPDVRTDASCAASPGAASAVQAVRAGGFTGTGRIMDLFR